MSIQTRALCPLAIILAEDSFLFVIGTFNTLSKDAFHRVSLIEAHNTTFDYDIISLCETSLNDTIQIPDNILPGYKYYPCNHPDGSRNGGVGMAEWVFFTKKVYL